MPENQPIHGNFNKIVVLYLSLDLEAFRVPL